MPAGPRHTRNHSDDLCIVLNLRIIIIRFETSLMPRQPNETFIARPGPGLAEGEIDLGTAQRRTDDSVKDFIQQLLLAALPATDGMRTRSFDLPELAGDEGRLSGRLYGQAHVERQSELKISLEYRLFNTGGALVFSGTVDCKP